MKILQINAVYGFRSTGVIVRDIEEAVEADGGVSLVAYQEASTTPKMGYRIGNKLDWKMHAFFSRLFGKQAYFSRCATKKLLRYIDKEKPDIVHLHNLHSNYIHLNCLLKYLGERNIPTVITMHDCWYFTGKCYHFVDVGCEKFVTGCGNCPKKRGTPHTFFFDTSKRVYKDRVKYLMGIPRLKIVGCSDWICGEARRGFLRNADITRIYNGIDIDIFTPSDTSEIRGKYDIPEDAFVIMGMANKWLLPENRELFEKTCETLSEKKRLLIVGCTGEDARVIRERDNPYIIPVGYISEREELAKLYSLANVFVNSTYADTLPTVNMESICCGTPVITYDVCGSPELVPEGCGEVVPQANVEAMLRAIDESWEKIKPEALNIARRDFDKNECYKKYLSLYEQILEK